MEFAEKEEAQKVKMSTSPSHFEMIQNCLVDLLNGKSNNCVTVVWSKTNNSLSVTIQLNEASKKLTVSNLKRLIQAYNDDTMMNGT